jgi:hypothetical protein
MSSFGMYYESLWDIKESPEEELSRLIQSCFFITARCKNIEKFDGIISPPSKL